MSREDVIEGIEKFLRQHKNGSGGSIHQEPYKGDFFGLFAAAYNGGLIDPGHPGCLSADALADALSSRSPELLKQETWRDLYTFWFEWTYAWRQVHFLKR